MIIKYRQRRLAATEEELDSLVRDVERQAGMCGHCGAFMSIDAETRPVLEELRTMLARIREMKDEPWSME